jgi:hypothetical protein
VVPARNSSQRPIHGQGVASELHTRKSETQESGRKMAQAWGFVSVPPFAKSACSSAHTHLRARVPKALAFCALFSWSTPKKAQGSCTRIASSSKGPLNPRAFSRGPQGARARQSVCEFHHERPHATNISCVHPLSQHLPGSRACALSPRQHLLWCQSCCRRD